MMMKLFRTLLIKKDEENDKLLDFLLEIIKTFIKCNAMFVVVNPHNVTDLTECFIKRETYQLLLRLVGDKHIVNSFITEAYDEYMQERAYTESLMKKQKEEMERDSYVELIPTTE